MQNSLILLHSFAYVYIIRKILSLKTLYHLNQNSEAVFKGY